MDQKGKNCSVFILITLMLFCKNLDSIRILTTIIKVVKTLQRLKNSYSTSFQNKQDSCTESTDFQMMC